MTNNKYLRQEAYTMAYLIARFDMQLLNALGYTTKKSAYKAFASKFGYTWEAYKQIVQHFQPIAEDCTLKGWRKSDVFPSKLIAKTLADLADIDFKYANY